MKAKSTDSAVANAMWRDIRCLLAHNYPEESQEIALMVLTRLATHIAVDCISKERAPAALSRMINHFLLADHYE